MEGRLERAGDWFIDSIADAVAERLKSYNPEKRIFNLEEAAKYLGMSEDAVVDLVNRGRLKELRLTRRKQFDIVDLNATIDASRGA